MNLWTVPTIRMDAGGLRIFDNRPFGYDLDYATKLIGNLYEGNQVGLNLYLGLQRKLDTLFPILFAIAMPWALWVLTARWNNPFRVALCVAAFLGPMCDLIENYFVGGLLRAGVDDITKEMVARASFFSVTKWVLDVTAGAVFLILASDVLLDRWRRG